MKHFKKTVSVIISILVIGTLLFLPLACNDSTKLEPNAEQNDYFQKVKDFNDFYSSKIDLTKSNGYNELSIIEKLDLATNGTSVNSQRLIEWSKQLNIEGKSISKPLENSNLRTNNGEVVLSVKQIEWLNKIQAEVEKCKSKEDAHTTFKKLENELNSWVTDEDKMPIYAAITVGNSIIDKAFDEAKTESNGRLLQPTRCGFWRWTCIVTTTAVVAAIGYAGGGVLGGGLLGFIAYDIAKCCICCPGSCSNSYFCEIKKNKNSLASSNIFTT